jgi:flavin-dependent dehydrogenase
MATSREPRPTYDVVVVGARAAGAATAMLAARAGLRVLVVDRGRYGADTVSTHALMRGGVLQLDRWGLLPEVVAAGTPPIRKATFHYRDTSVAVDIGPSHGVDALYAPRRTVLDPLLVDAAAEAGAEVRFGVAVHDLRRDDRGRVVGIEATDRLGQRFAADARLVVGADGLRSVVAARVGAPTLLKGEGASAWVYGYWAGVEADGYEWAYRPGATAGVIPTNDGQACVFAGTTAASIGRRGRAAFEPLLEAASSSIAARVLEGRLVGNLRSFVGQPGYLRKAWGPGWALVGDAGYWKDPLSAHGITDALRDAELLSRAIVASVEEGDEAGPMQEYQNTRDRLSQRMFAVTDTLARQCWDDQEIGGLLRELSAAANDEVDVLASLSPMTDLAAVPA